MTPEQRAGLARLLADPSVEIRLAARALNAALDPDERLADPVGERTAELVALNPRMSELELDDFAAAMIRKNIPMPDKPNLEHAFLTAPRTVVKLRLS